MLWWRYLPQLVALAEKDASAKLAGSRTAIRDVERANAAGCSDAQAAGYRLDLLARKRDASERIDESKSDDSVKKSERIAPPKGSV